MLNEEFYSLIDNLALINEDNDVDVKTAEEMEDEVKKENGDVEETSDEDPREAVRNAIKPQVDVANSIISSIKDAFADNCNNIKQYSNFEKQIQNWEKTIRGAAQQILSINESKKMIIKNAKGKYVAWDERPVAKICDPRSFAVILNNDSRDLDAVKLSGAIITFYNSLL